MASYLGERDGFRFLIGAEGITVVGAPARGGPDHRFEERLIDLAVPARQTDEINFRGALPENEDHTVVDGRQFPVSGKIHLIGPTAGFGRSLRYQSVATDTVGRTAVLLTADLPSLARYEVRWDATSRVGDTFGLSGDLDVTVLTDLPWTFESGLFAVETGATKSKVTFLFEGRPPTTPLQDAVLVVAEGHEREALSVRAALGSGFVPCFVAAGDRIPDSHGSATSIFLGPGGVTGLDADVRVLRELGRPIPDRTVTVADGTDSHGPGLYLAIRHRARLRWDPASGTRASLSEADGTVVQEWELSDLLGRVLPPVDAEADADPGPELVLCENILADLLVCQAVGYASAFGHGIAFLPAIDPVSTATSRGRSQDFDLLSDLATRAVPPGLRSPSVESLTIFTRELPLHLTSIDGTDRWLNRYRLAHLPGRTASLAVPRAFARSAATPPKITFSVVFDTLASSTDTEAVVFAGRTAEVLHHPLLFQGAQAKRTVLREALERLVTDLVVLITHGRDDYIEDVDNSEITASEVSGWALRGEPMILNNSCSSWLTTGEAFLVAGARSVIGTLWPVDNAAARRIGTRIAERIHAGVPVDPAELLREATEAERATDHVTAAAYVYVGVPTAVSFSTMAVDFNEVADHFTAATEALVDVISDIADEAGPDVFHAFRYAMYSTLQQRASASLAPGAMPLPLEGQFAPCTMLDMDFLLATVGAGLGLMLWKRVPDEGLSALAEEIDQHLLMAVSELGSWDDRHDAHLRRKRQDVSLPPELTGLEIGALGEWGFIDLAARLTLTRILPFSALVAAMPGRAERETARKWFAMAALMVTMPPDLEPDRSVRDEVLIARIVEGIKVPLRLLHDFTGVSQSARVPEVDLLARAVPKDELANRFGVVLIRLGERERAIPFFTAALHLTEPGSATEANVRSNLAHYGLADDSPWSPFEAQAASGDPVNASITAANVLLRAASQGRPVSESQIRRVLSVIDTIDPTQERARHLCDFLSATSVYLASTGRYKDAAHAQAEVRGLLPQAGPAAAKCLGRLSSWYYDDARFARAAQTLLTDGATLEKLGWNEAAARAYTRGADAAGEEGNRRSLRSWNPSVLIECSQRLGRLFSLYPEIRAVLGEHASDFLQNAVSIRQAFARTGLLKSALAAYRAERAWPNSTPDPGWDLLADAFHERNAADFHTLAESGQIRRLLTVTFDTRARARIDTTTTWLGPSETGPPGVIAYLPLHHAAATSANEPYVRASAWAAFELRPGRPVTITQEDADVLTRRDAGLLLLARRCGSRSVHHELEIFLPPGWVPARASCRRVVGPSVVPSVSLAGDCFRLSFSSPLEAGPWLADLTVKAIPAPFAVFMALALQTPRHPPGGPPTPSWRSPGTSWGSYPKPG